MKFTSLRRARRALLLFALAGGISAANAQPSPTPPVTAPTEQGTEWSWEKLKAAEFEQRETFIEQVRALHARFEIEIAQLRTRFKETDATESQKKAMIELDKAEVDFEEKMKALDNVTRETWETVKSNLLSSWLNLQEAYKKTKPTE